MFLNFLKEFFLKRKLKNSFSNVKSEAGSGSVKTVGLLLDEASVSARENMVSALVQQGIAPVNIGILAFRNRIKKSEVFDYPVFSMADMGWAGSISKREVTEFVARPFDLLISYYDVEKHPLMLVTQKSKAGFKVGFAAVDKRLNHFTVGVAAAEHQVFISELFRYLKILKKL